MKFTIDKTIFLKGLDDVIRAIDPNNIYIHLRNFYIEVLDQMITIKGSNGYFSIEHKINSSNIENIEKIGSFLVPASLFINVIRKCNGKISFEIINTNTLKITNNKDDFEVNLVDVNEYPTIDFTLYGNKIKVNAEKFRNAVNDVIFASSQSSEEIILSGINLRYEMGKLYVTATDSFRLAREIIEIQDDRNISFDVTITNKNIKNFIPQNVEGDVIFYANEHKINVIHETSNFQSKIIEAPYKNVGHLFETKFDKELIIDRMVLNNAISKATVVSSTEFNKIYISINKNEITLSTSAEEIGRTKVVLSKEEFEYKANEPINIVLNYKFLKEAISVFNDKISIYLTNSKGLIQIGSEKSTNKQIISPMMS